MALSANTGGRIVRFRLCPSRRTRTAACSAITGIRWRAAWRSSIRRNKLEKKRLAARCDDSARKVKTAHVPVVLDPMVSRSMLEHIFEGVNGDSVYRGASFLAGKLGEKIAGANVNVIDDGTMSGGFGTTPFDGEGIPTRRTVVIENGILKSYLLNTYTAKKLGMETTANASRGLAGTPGIGPGIIFWSRGRNRRSRLSRRSKTASM